MFLLICGIPITETKMPGKEMEGENELICGLEVTICVYHIYIFI